MVDHSGARRHSSQVPTPPHPHERREPLPGHRPKPHEDDALATQGLEAILASPSYREADRDTDFLQQEVTRGVRLQIDYSKAESLLEQHDVAHTIVVFGSTRIPEPQAARRQLEDCAKAVAANRNDPALRRRLLIAERIETKSRYYEIAREFGRIVGTAGAKALNGRIMIMTGGGPGIMEAASRGAHDVGAKSIGLNIALPKEQYPNPYLTPELSFRFHYFAIRKLHFLLRARALVAFPGGYGTMDELFEVLSLAQTRKIKPVPVILVGEEYWRRVFDPEFLIDEGVIDPEDRDLFWYAESAEGIFKDIVHWYEASGQPLFPIDALPQVMAVLRGGE
jgi:uncharacterized protein (TIGR00730 family)